jgi:cupin 2 domain-containing protein
MDHEIPEIKNLFDGIPVDIDEEFSEDLVTGKNVRIERIVSAGHASGEGFWYDQIENEWVILLCGSAGLRFEGVADPVILRPGDHVNIPAGRKHRVEWTAPEEKTVWLAVFY